MSHFWSRAGARGESVAFLFLGELFLIPHLLPIAAAMARRADAPSITMLVVTSIHEEIVEEALAKLGLLGRVRVVRARGYRRLPPGSRAMPPLPHKLLLLARNAATILRHDVAVVAERTSLWLPRIARRRGAAFVYNEHGAGPHANFRSPRNRFATRILMPGDGMAERVRESGHADAPIEIVGYIKRDYIREVSGSGTLPPFAEARPTVVYVPHWLRCKSSWWSMGREVLDHFARSPQFNLVVAPHIRLFESDPEFEARVAPYRDCPNIHVDSGTFRLIDQSYINAADIYLGDGSSQVVEFAERPRPAIFLNPDGHDWAVDPRFSHWRMGAVARDLAGLHAALADAFASHDRFAPIQRNYVTLMMGEADGQASERAADAVGRVLLDRRLATAPLTPEPVLPLQPAALA